MLVGHVPQLFVVFMQQDDGAGGLHVERAGGVEQRVLDELDDTGVGNGGFFLQLDGGAADDGGLEERDFGSHADWGGHLGWVCLAEG